LLRFEGKRVIFNENFAKNQPFYPQKSKKGDFRIRERNKVSNNWKFKGKYVMIIANTIKEVVVMVLHTEYVFRTGPALLHTRSSN